MVFVAVLDLVVVDLVVVDLVVVDLVLPPDFGVELDFEVALDFVFEDDFVDAPVLVYVLDPESLSLKTLSGPPR